MREMFKNQRDDNLLEESEYTSMLLPFLNKEEKPEEKPEEKVEQETLNKEKNTDKTIKTAKTSYGERIEMLLSEMSPLEALKKKVMAEEPDIKLCKEDKEEILPLKEEPKPDAQEKSDKTDLVDDTYAEIFKSIEEKVEKTQKPKEKGSQS